MALSDLQVLCMYVYSYWSPHEYHKILSVLLTSIHLLHLNIQLPFIVELGFVLCLQDEPQLEPMRPPLTSKTPLHCSEQLLEWPDQWAERMLPPDLNPISSFTFFLMGDTVFSKRLPLQSSLHSSWAALCGTMSCSTVCIWCSSL